MENPPLMQNRLVNTKLQYIILSVLSLKINKKDANDHYVVSSNFTIYVASPVATYFFFLKKSFLMPHNGIVPTTTPRPVHCALIYI